MFRNIYICTLCGREPVIFPDALQEPISGPAVWDVWENRLWTRCQASFFVFSCLIWPLPASSQLLLAGTLRRWLDLQKTLLNGIQIAAQFCRILEITIYLACQVGDTPPNNWCSIT